MPEQTAGRKPIDAAAFARDIDSLRAETLASLSGADYRHLLRIQWYGRIALALGLGTAWLFPNPISAFLLSVGLYTRWVIAHHVLHRGYDHVPGIPAKFTSKVFARGWRRFIDWFDWIEPESWVHTHNTHHYHTGECHDPDLVERHVEFIRTADTSKAGKYLLTLIGFMTWKFTYYAPTSMSVVEPETGKRLPLTEIKYLTHKNLFDFSNGHIRNVWKYCYAPYFGAHFVVLPLLFLPLGWFAVFSVFINRLLAEIMTNIHAFMVIGSNHTGADLPLFDFHFDNKEQFYVTQVAGTANYRCGNDFCDLLHFWLNYQIEHHLFPDLPMLKYREIQPKVKALCAKHGLPYVQESLFVRVRKLLDICVGNSDCRVIKDFSAVCYLNGIASEGMRVSCK